MGNIIKKTQKFDIKYKQDYYKNNKGRLREPARDKYKILSEEEKNKKREYGKNRYHNMSEEKKQGLKEYQKNYCEAKNIYSKEKPVEHYAKNKGAIKQIKRAL